ncbi:MAG: Alginate biosynthesis protein AlgA [Chlamydiae bacterium]|nr:Alginate biosynthesis protein AlgA [Chlamydiota bacterium]
MKILILAGGFGTRLWPLSRATFPKQFLRFGSKESLLQKTVIRFLLRNQPSDLVIITQKEMSDLVKAEVSQIDPLLKERVLIEPAPRSTTPAILLALHWLEERNEHCDTFLVTPSDHLISPEETFLNQVDRAEEIAQKGELLTFGVYPSHPHTGYGYIKHSRVEEGVADAVQFIEKPSLAKAQSMLASGSVLWNAGIFLFHRECFLNEIKEHQPEMFAAYSGDLLREFATLPNLSVDYALLEHVESLKVVPLTVSWSDVGSWDNLHEILPQDEQGNVTIGNVALMGTENCLIYGDKRLIATVDVEDLHIVDSEDALLIAKKGSSQKLRELVKILQQKKEPAVDIHPTVFRPWGSYTVLEEGEGYKIKKIAVIPRQQLSLQYHQHRSEHWVVIEGEGVITLGEEEVLLRKNESIFVPKELPHRIANQTDHPLAIIEVQVGEYVGEDDIIRLDDIYGRVATVENN